MTREEFNKWLYSLTDLDDMLIFLRYKYNWELEYTYSIEYLYVDFDSPSKFTWLNDWNEGQKDVIFIGFIKISDIPTNIFKPII